MERSAPEEQRSCSDCNTTKTPLWRGGPLGPKSLCNACGIRYRKKIRALMVINNKQHKCKTERSRNKLGIFFNPRLLVVGADAVLQSNPLQENYGKLGEEEEAAFVLMAISSGLVNA